MIEKVLLGAVTVGVAVRTLALVSSFAAFKVDFVFL